MRDEIEYSVVLKVGDEFVRYVGEEEPKAMIKWAQSMIRKYKGQSP